MTLKLKHLIYLIFCCLVVGVVLSHRVQTVHRQQAIQEAQRAKQMTQKTKQEAHATSTAAVGAMRQPINWRKSSETKPYPNLAAAKHLWVKVQLKQNRTYVYDGKKLIYTMYCTGGKYRTDPKTGEQKSMTPTGTYHIEDQRGDSFYNSELQEGAKYYVSWKNHGTYLFHSVPTSSGGKINTKEAAKLGKTQGSHGCVRLSVPDARWFSKTVPVGTKVVITN